MAAPRLWYWPNGSGAGTMQVIDFDEELSECTDTPWSRGADGRSLGGSWTLARFSAGLRVRFTVDNFTDADLVRKLQNLEDYLKGNRAESRRGSIGLAADGSKAWCGYLTKPALRGDTSLFVGGNVWHTAGTGGIADGDKLCLESALPAGMRERTRKNGASTSTSTALALSDAIEQNTGSTGVVKWVRHELYWPILLLPADQLSRPLLRTDFRNVWSFEVTLEFDIAGMAALEAYGDTLLNLSTTDAFGGKESVDAVRDRKTQRFSAARSSWGV